MHVGHVGQPTVLGGWGEGKHRISPCANLCPSQMWLWNTGFFFSFFFFKKWRLGHTGEYCRACTYPILILYTVIFSSPWLTCNLLRIHLVADWEALMDAKQTGALFLAEFQKDFCIILVLQSRLMTSSQTAALWRAVTTEVELEFYCSLELAALIDEFPPFWASSPFAFMFQSCTAVNWRLGASHISGSHW